MDDDELMGWRKILSRCRLKGDPLDFDLDDLENFIRTVRSLKSDKELMANMITDLQQDSIAYQYGFEDGQKDMERKYQSGKLDADGELRILLRSGKRIAAVKKFRELKGCGLKEAVQGVDAMMKLIFGG